jgi:paraquat-inducible protein B
MPHALVSNNSRSPLALIWIVPAIAVLIALGLAVHAVLARGPEITVQLPTAEGLEANKTKVKYKDVAVGTVTSIALSDDRRSVNATVAMDKQAAPLLVENSRFWVVRPRIGAGGISGLNTLLSGAYIAIDPGTSKESRRSFTGLDAPPLVVSGMAGRQFLLVADNLGSLDVGAPVYYRRIQVGRVVGYAMRPDGKAVDVRIFVDAPYDRFVTANSRFWHASGVDVSLDSDGLKVETQSLVSLVVGGIAFTSLNGDANAEPAEAPADSSFALYSDQPAALRLPDSVVMKYVLIFNESVRGLAVGSPVDFRGLVAGEVSRIDLDFRPTAGDIAMAVEINLYPERFARRERVKQPAARSQAAIHQIIDAMVAKGLRGQLRTGNLLTGQRYVALDYFPKTKAAQVKWGPPMPELPTQPGALDSLQDQLQGVMEALHKTLNHADKLMADTDRNVVPELSATLADARKALNKADRLLASDAPTQLQLRDTLREVGQAAAAVRNLSDLLERHPESLLTGRRTDQ